MSGFTPSEQKHYARTLIKKRHEIFVSEHSPEKLEQLRRGLQAKTQIQAPAIIDDIMALGFTEDTIAVLPFIPMIQMAWADGDVSGREAREILKKASTDGLSLGGAAYRLVNMFLDEHPSDDFMKECLCVLNDWYQTLSTEQSQAAKTNLLGFARVVAEASGGVLGFFGDKVDENERALLERFQSVFAKGAQAESILQTLVADEN